MALLGRHQALTRAAVLWPSTRESTTTMTRMRVFSNSAQPQQQTVGVHVMEVKGAGAQ